jgi:hypothetical protein
VLNYFIFRVWLSWFLSSEAVAWGVEISIEIRRP